MLFTADFETTTDPNDCRVWAWGLCQIGNVKNFKHGKDIDSLIEECRKEKENTTLYFHNLKFDGEFIIYWLFHNGYRHVVNKEDFTDFTFTTLISDMGMFYSIKIFLRDNNKKKKTLTILDSLKVIPLPVSKVAKAFDLPFSKLEIDYHEKREIGHEATPEEIEYIRADVTIMALALMDLFEQKLTKMTTGANALCDFKRIFGKKNFDRTFPIPQYDADVRQAYKGGWTYLKEEHKEQDIADGLVFDVNSLYPFVMYERMLPYGEGVYFDGAYIQDDTYNLYTSLLTCQFELKENHLPTIQIKGSLSFNPTDYLTSSNGEAVTLCLTNVDLALLFEHYHVYDIVYHHGWKFKSTNKIFRDYIDKWSKVKIQATEEGNGGKRTIAKLMLNSLYGKFALNPNVASKYPYLSQEDKVSYKLSPPETRSPIYIPVGVFITSWARDKTIRAAQANYERFIYADTDSLHLKGLEIPDNLEISETKLGAWKLESKFTRARFLRAKSYIEEIDGNLKITCAGMPPACYNGVNWDNFKIGNSFNGKLKHTHVKGGVILAEAPHTLRK